MSRSKVYFVSDDVQAQENTKKMFEADSQVTVQVYTESQWSDALNSPSMRNNMHQGFPVLTGGAPQGGGKVLQFPAVSGNGQVATMNELESQAIEAAIDKFNGNLTEAAKALGIGRATLYRKVKLYNIDPSPARKKRAA